MGIPLTPTESSQRESDFPDAPHVDALARALWTQREFGRAAVLVGAGMSRNALPRQPGQPPMPLWREVTDALIDRLYPPGSGSERRRKYLQATAAGISVSARLADEYAVAFGRHELDALLRELVPDAEYAPGPIHEQLLRLPWADVLTTNWDTLLERAGQSVNGRRYTAVRRPEEIPTSARPRIVKLHGSFPSNGPFILTEEDFRTYPARHAPFVNLVRQAVLENALCLIGFSGDDPNFLAWSGWVRDELAEYAPRIYLCGVLGLTPPERALLSQRGVIPIDLSSVFPVNKFPDTAARHARALEWFLLRLASARPYDPLRWPDPPSASSPEVPERSGNRAPKREPRYLSDAQKDASAESDPFVPILAIWIHNRASYPGWLVAPASVREDVFGNTEHLIVGLLARLPSLTPDRSLPLLSELAWRLDLCLIPLASDLARAMETAVTAVNPFPDVITDLPDGAASPLTELGKALDWDALRSRWVGLAFELLRWYREERLDEPFAQWSERIGRLEGLTSDDRARWCYERCLYALGRMDDAAVRTALEQWPDDCRDPAWLVRKGGVTAEIGEVRDGLRLVTMALGRLRQGSTDSPSQLDSLSREGWAMRLVSGLGSDADVDRTRGSDWVDPQERYAQLRRFDCDPWELTAWFGPRLSGPPPRRQPSDLVRAGFEPGTGTRTVSLGGSDFEKRLLPMYQYSRLLEVAGLPPATPGVSFSTEQYATLAFWFTEADPVRTQSAVFRRLDKKMVEEYLTRARVAALETAHVREWISMTMRVVGEVAPSLGVTHWPTSTRERRARDRLNGALEILSRLALRATETECGLQWELLEQLYQTPVVRILHAEQVLRQWTRSLVSATPDSTLATKFIDLLDLPMAGEPPFPVLNEHFWPDPILYFCDRPIVSTDGLPGASLRQAVQKALTAMRAEAFPLRRAGLLRMYTFRQLDLLTADEARSASATFWETIQDDPDKAFVAYGLAALRIALHFMTASEELRIRRVKAHILGWKPGPVVGGMVNPDEMLTLTLETCKSQHPPSRVPKFHWDSADVKKLFDTLRDWWNSLGSKALAAPVRGGFGSLDHHVLSQFLSSLIDVLRHLLLPTARRASRFGRDLVQFVEELRAARVAVGSVLPATFLVRDASDDTIVASILRHDLASRDPDRQVSALRGLISWATLTRNHRQGGRQVPELPVALIREVGAQIAVRRPQVLRWGLQCARELLALLGPTADRRFRSSLFIALDFLAVELRYGGDDMGGEIPSDDVPLLRAEAARLAKRLANQGHGKEPSVARWIEGATNDPLPEVRDAVSPGRDVETPD